MNKTRESRSPKPKKKKEERKKSVQFIHAVDVYGKLRSSVFLFFGRGVVVPFYKEHVQEAPRCELRESQQSESPFIRSCK